MINLIKKLLRIKNKHHYFNSKIKTTQSELNNKKVVILVPVSSYIEPAVDESLRKLESLGYTVWRKYGWSAIDQGRCAMAQEALDAGFEYLFWIDSDVCFWPHDVEKVLNHRLPFVTAPYCVKGWPVLTTEFIDKNILLGEQGGLYPVKYSATGFMCVHRSVYENMAAQLNMKKLKIWGGQYEAYPFFFPIIENDEYLGEDFAFCKRARDIGVNLFCDTTIRLSHIGKYSYSFNFLKNGVKDEPECIKYTQTNQLKVS